MKNSLTVAAVGRILTRVLLIEITILIAFAALVSSFTYSVRSPFWNEFLLLLGISSFAMIIINLILAVVFLLVKNLSRCIGFLLAAITLLLPGLISLNNARINVGF